MDDRFRRRIVWAFGISAVVNTVLIAILFWLVLDSRAEPPKRAPSIIDSIGTLDATVEAAKIQRQIDELRWCQKYPNSLGC